MEIVRADGFEKGAAGLIGISKIQKGLAVSKQTKAGTS